MKIIHSEMVSRLVKKGRAINMELEDRDAHIMHMMIGISGEAGELLDAGKKGFIYRKGYDRINIIEELGDLEFYMEGLRQAFNLSRDQTLEANIEKLGKRYEGLKYSDEAAQNRADKK